MQTFLPYPSFVESAACLDNKRLGKQRVECKQILKALMGEYANTGAWVNHPACKMWIGYEEDLLLYAVIVCNEWRSRGFSDSLLPYFQEKLNEIPEAVKVPSWLGNKAFHASHRSNLLRKDPVYYGKFGWPEPDDLPYVWPV